MDVEKAKSEVIEAGHRLVETGLIARTWGNVSCRIDDRSFAITPSGRDYVSLTPDDIVVVDIADLHYDGDIKPSSEKGIHAMVYAQRPEMNFVIHTHQAAASVAGVLGKDVEVKGSEAKQLLGGFVPLASYGLPGTKKLCKGVAGALGRTEGRAVLMAYHGALVFGESPEAAFSTALTLEEECRRFYATYEDKPVRSMGHSVREGSAFTYHDGDMSSTVDIGTGQPQKGPVMPVEAQWHLAVYRARTDINVIRGCTLPGVMAVSQKTTSVKPLLDDFAQLIGPSSRVASAEPSAIVRALRGRNAVLVAGVGALCCAGSEDDAEAVEMVLEKGCDAYLAAQARGAVKPISPIECRLMRFVYLNKYSKIKKKKRS
jgi:ribulose-5-phosphate 4-epimerase/fuculose-1-phosphate aldolase